MSDVKDFYQQQAKQSQSDIPWLNQLQHAARHDFDRLGFPARSDEEWKYTSVAAFLKQYFVACDEVSPTTVEAVKITHLPVDAFRIDIINGQVMGTEALEQALPKGVLVLPLKQALQMHAEKIKPYLGQILSHQHGFQALNTAMLQSGVFIYVPHGVTLNKPLLLSHWQDQPLQAVHIRHLVIADSASSVTLIEDYQGDASIEYFTNAMTEVFNGESSKITHYKIQRESKSAYHTGHLAVNQSAGSSFDSHLFSFGGRWVRADTTFNLQQPRARCFMNGIYATSQGQHMDHHTLVNHIVPDCESVQDYKGILSGQSRAVFNGKVIVAKHAQHTQAKQQNKNLLLSSAAEIDTKPQLEIFADDVVCTHGATVGQLDEEALFYLATRGIEPKHATQYLIQAFAVDNLRAVQDEHLAAFLSLMLNEQMG